MIKETISYTDFNGNEHTEDFYFNLSDPELIEMEVEVKGGMSNFLEDIVAAEDTKTLVAQFKKLVLLAYGEKSEDGKRFVKTPEIRDAFEQHAAYPVIFMMLASDDKAAARFVNGVIPASSQTQDQDKPTGPPNLPQTPQPQQTPPPLPQS